MNDAVRVVTLGDSGRGATELVAVSIAYFNMIKPRLGQTAIKRNKLTNLEFNPLSSLCY